MSAPLQATVGFMPLLDCALLVAAHEAGIAARHGLALRLVRETSWANVRDRLAVGHFDAAQMLGPMVVAEALGLGPFRAPLLAPVSLGLGGNVITVSCELWSQMQVAGAAHGATPRTQAEALARVIARRMEQGQGALTLAMVFPYSCHHYQLRDWLALSGIDADRDVRLVVLPPSLLADALRLGQVDGFCAGEPWGSIAVDAGSGVIVALCNDMWEQPTEKVIGLRADRAERQPELVTALVRSVVDAARWASDARNRDALVGWLAEPRYVGARPALLHAALAGELRMAIDTAPVTRAGFLQLDVAATRPEPRYADLICEHMVRCGQVTDSAATRTRARAAFRNDLYSKALDTKEDN
ncbi:MAG: CmpA/NrtA family ABC transporter substrate-binding protein [Pseudomonadota bacterium]